MMARSSPFATEAEMVACWLAEFRASRRRAVDWTVYPETAGWDLLLVHKDGYQVGLEAKLSLNAKVIAQALAGSDSYWREEGPDYRGVLVPRVGVQHNLTPICRALGLGVLIARPPERGVVYSIGLPDQSGWSSSEWPCWLPAKRCVLPDYIPDVEAGHKSPVQLTPWKVKAIKLMILLERRGFVTRSDMKALEISPTRWTDYWAGFLSLSRELGGYVPNGRTPDLRAQHPVNYAQIEADFSKWCPPGYRFEAEQKAAANG